jgi:hypothetical protein
MSERLDDDEQGVSLRSTNVLRKPELSAAEVHRLAMP